MGFLEKKSGGGRDILKSSRALEMKKKRRSRLRLRVFLWLLAGILFIVGLSYLSKLPAMRIEHVVISGNSTLDTGDLLHAVQDELFGNYFGLFSKQNGLIYPKEKIQAHLLDTFKRLEGATITLSDLHTLYVAVSERDARYLWCGHDFDETAGESSSVQCYYLDANGYIFSEAPYFSGNAFFKFYGTGLFNRSISPIGQEFLSRDDFSKLLAFRDRIQSFGLTPYGILLEPNGEYALYIAPLSSDRMIHTKIMFNQKNDLDTIADNLATALATEPFASDFKKKFDTLLYIDLRFTNKVYYKFAEAGSTPMISTPGTPLQAPVVPANTH